VPLEGHIIVLGLGRSGMAAARHIAARAVPGARVSVYDAAYGPALEKRAQMLRDVGVDVELGASDFASDATLVVASPGIPPASPLMRAARRTGAPVISEIELAYRVSRSPWLAVTGTNGKTTTTMLVTHLLRTAGIPCETVGNIGDPAIGIAGDTGEATVLVTEVSSFQLALTERFHPHVSVLLNVTPDHIDWHGSLEAYARDKGRVFANQGPGDVAVIDIDDPGAAAFAEPVAARGVRVVRVTLGAPDDDGAGVVGGMLMVRHGGRDVVLVRADELPIRGEHNVSNALAASAAALAAGADPDSVREGLRTFQPVAHRLEPVGEVRGAEYFNDSKATNPDAVNKALTAFDDRPLIVLLGGRNKGNDFRGLAEAVAARCRAAVLFGEAGPEIAQAFAEGSLPLVVAGDLAAATHAANDLARPGDVVLLSPACASFDEFSNYEERGERFRDLVAMLAEREGE